jgi:hypothetical protein
VTTPPATNSTHHSKERRRQPAAPSLSCDGIANGGARALIEGEREFPEPFDDEHGHIVPAAFAAIKVAPPSWRKDECCSSLLRAIGRSGPIA